MVAWLIALSLALPAAPEKAADKPAPLPDTFPDPGVCRVILDDMGAVGYRISDAQMLAETTMSEMQKRLGYGGIVYAGTVKNAHKMKRMLGPSAETQLQDDQIEYHRRAEAAATHRIRVRFKKKKGQHHITVTCRKQGDAPGKVIEKKVFTGQKFREVRQSLAEGLPGFCTDIVAAPGMGARPAAATGGQRGEAGGPPGLSATEKARRKRLQEWSPPPPRK